MSKPIYYVRIMSVALLLTVAIVANSCKVKLLSFQGTSLPESVQTVSIQNFYNEVGNGPANMSIQLTELLKEYFLRNTRLSLVQVNGDIQLEGSIVGYEVTPVAPTGDQIAGLQRLTINVKTQYYNTQVEDKDFDKNFSQFEDFNPNQNLAEVEEELVNIILERIVFDIFNDTAADW
ncbi:MAG: LptE family protein [Bernardetiaceae bacterium]|nr:LptE family protein [Bernardetiaceae bacterium]